MRHEFDFYETPDPLTEWLFSEHDIQGECYEPCVGDGAIIRASNRIHGARNWRTNDLDPRWEANTTLDAASIEAWQLFPDWVVSNTPFSHWNQIAERAYNGSRTGVALYLRLSAHEPKKSEFKGWWSKFPPSHIYICPRFAHQRSRRSGQWSTDSVTCCWTVWDKRAVLEQRIIYAPDSVIDALDAYTPSYRDRMDALMAKRAA